MFVITNTWIHGFYSRFNQSLTQIECLCGCGKMYSLGEMCNHVKDLWSDHIHPDEYLDLAMDVLISSGKELI